jgi:hypothetical protein
MKRVFFLLFSIIILSSLLLTACGGNSTPEQTPAASSPPATTQSGVNISQPTTSAASSSGSGLWNDMPVYSGASEIQKGSWAIPPTEGDYSKFEWRYFETSDSSEAVANFYKGQMPGKGWQQQGWMDTPEVSWGFFNKNDENDSAMIWITAEDSKTVFATWRGTK